MEQAMIESLPGYVELVTEREREICCVDPGRAYPIILAELKSLFPEAEANRYWIEISRRCISNDLKNILHGEMTEERRARINNGDEAAPPAVNIRFVSDHILDKDGERTGERTGDMYALKNLEEPKGFSSGQGEAMAASTFNQIYKKLIASRKA